MKVPNYLDITPKIYPLTHTRRYGMLLLYHDERLSKGFRPEVMPLFFYPLLYSNLFFKPFIKSICEANFLNKSAGLRSA